MISLIAVLVVGVSCDRNADAAPQASAAAPTVVIDSVRPALTADERRSYREMAQRAWSYMTAHYDRSTGLVAASPEWAYTTMWDVGGQLLAFHSAKELGLLTQQDYDARMRKVLGTLERVRSYDSVAFHKIYSTRDGSVAKESSPGWTSTDLGRFLVALKVIAERDPQHAEQVARVARRIDVKQIAKDGYLYGQHVTNGSPRLYQEGRIGYEQYVAAGFAHWGADVQKALDVTTNAQPVTVLGVPLLKDARYQDRLLSEPFILYQLELGLPPAMRELAANVLKAQEARYQATGKVTIASEDAVSIPPNYFYYYCVYCNGKPFVIDISRPGHERESPRWVSTKATFGWHAIMPNDYTKKATEFVAAAFDPKRGWASGVYEDSGRSTRTYDVNTAAVLLEIALYQLRGGRPLIEPASVSH